VVAGLALFLLAAALVAVAIRTVTTVLPGPESLPQILRGIELLTIAVAVFEVAKFLLEEELIRERELRSITDVRLSLTKSSPSSSSCCRWKELCWCSRSGSTATTS
jgi:TctA family transporter